MKELIVDSYKLRINYYADLLRANPNQPEVVASRQRLLDFLAYFLKHSK